MKRTFLSLAVCMMATPTFANDQIIISPKPEMLRNKVDFLEMDLNVTVANVKVSNAKNVETTTLNGGIAYKTYGAVWGQEYVLDAVRSSNSSSTIDVERYLASAKAMKHLDASSGLWYGGGAYIYGKLQAEYDVATPYEYSIAPTVGYGRRLIQDGFQTLDVEVGAGGQYLRSDDDTDFQMLLTAEVEYDRQLTETLGFEQELALQFGSETRVLRSHTGLLSKLTDTLNAQLSYDIKSTDTDTVDTNDSLLSVGVRYRF